MSKEIGIGIEPCISLSKWDKHSTWKSLAKKLQIKSWAQILRDFNTKKQKGNDDV